MSTKWVEDLLREVGRSYSWLTEAEIDAILAKMPDVKVSAEFKERALKAMQEAQKRREQNRKT